jgi:hypothetical protein
LPVVRFSRDRRGYEHTYLVDVSTRAGKPTSRLLYWFRTPPGVKVGREPFDDEMRRTLESQYPDLTFDWKAIVATPMPAPTVDWRSRRLADRAAKAVRRAAELENVADVEDAIGDAGDLEAADTGMEDVEAPSSTDNRADPKPPGASDAGNRPGGGRRRRRRGGRHHRRGSAAAPPPVDRESEQSREGGPAVASIAAEASAPNAMGAERAEGAEAGGAGEAGRAGGAGRAVDEGTAVARAVTEEADERGTGMAGNWPPEGEQ